MNEGFHFSLSLLTLVIVCAYLFHLFIYSCDRWSIAVLMGIKWHLTGYFGYFFEKLSFSSVLSGPRDICSRAFPPTFCFVFRLPSSTYFEILFCFVLGNVLCFQNIEQIVQSWHMLLFSALFAFLVRSYVSAMHLLQLMNQYWYIITNNIPPLILGCAVKFWVLTKTSRPWITSTVSSMKGWLP